MAAVPHSASIKSFKIQSNESNAIRANLLYWRRSRWTSHFSATLDESMKNGLIDGHTNVNDYFVTNEMMDSLGWGVVLMLLGDPANEITDNAYASAHFRINLIMLTVLLSAVLPLCFLPRYALTYTQSSGTHRSIIFKVMTLVLFHLLLPVFILLLVPVFFASPL